ncbi:MAG: 3-oxoacyl-ACP reductase FabG [Planctomycetia bacterium]|nr:3-oxoacyl-ACP reductase FabG [Planctomycetia bacterium]
MTAEFHDRVAIVTGGSRGIGRAVALRLASEGANVAISFASRRDAAQETVEAIRAMGRKVVAERCNVAEPEEVARLADRSRRELGPIAFLAHCGAISNLADHKELSYDLWREMIDVNLTGTYNAVFAVKDEMIARGFGRIVTVSSIAALLPRKMQIHYSASKAGVTALTRCCAEAFAPHNVRINCVAPGLVETEMADVLPPDRKAEVIAATPMQRIGQPDELANVIRFLLSDESSYMTGQTIVASGGRMMMG